MVKVDQSHNRRGFGTGILPNNADLALERPNALTPDMVAQVNSRLLTPKRHFEGLRRMP